MKYFEVVPFAVRLTPESVAAAAETIEHEEEEA